MKGKSSSNMNKGVDVRDETPSMTYAGGDSNVVKEAKKYKRGGKIGKHVDAHGHAAKHRLDRPARKSGGRAGMSPFSAAHSVKNPPGRDMQSGES